MGLGDYVDRIAGRAFAGPLYRAGQHALYAGDVAGARRQASRLEDLRVPSAQRYASELTVWADLVSGDVTSARAQFTKMAHGSSLLRATFAVVSGEDPAAVTVLGQALGEVAAIVLVARALVACKRTAALAEVLEAPGAAVRFGDAELRRTSELAFRAGAYEDCEAISRAAFRAFGTGVHQYNIACCAAKRGEIDRAIDALLAAKAAGHDDRAWRDADPDLAEVRNSPRYGTV